NLTRDHLDYHQTMTEYFDAKRRLFDGRTGTKPGAVVCNNDDVYGEELVWECMKAGMKVSRYGIAHGVEAAASDLNVQLGGMSFTLHTPAGDYKLRSPLVGTFHVYNILAAVACGLA